MVLNYTPRAATPTAAEIKASMSIRDPFKAGRVTSLVVPGALAGGLTSKAGQAVVGAKNIFQRVTRYNPLAGTTLKGFGKSVAGKALGFLSITETFRAGQSLATGKPYNPIPSRQTLSTAAIASINPYGTYAGYAYGGVQNLFNKGKQLFTPANAGAGGIPWVNMTPANAKALPEIPQSVFYPEALSPTIIMPSAAAPNISYGAPSLNVSAGGGGFDPTLLIALLGGALGGGYLLGKRRRKKKKYKKRRSR